MTKKKKSKKSIIIMSILLLLIIGTCEMQPHYFKKVTKYFKKNIACFESKEKKYSSKLKSGLAEYMKFTKSNGALKCADEKDILLSNNLIKVNSTNRFKIDNLTHSYPYLTENGILLLNEIGESFYEKIKDTELKDTKFIVTSLTRTEESVKRLTGVNGNAVKRSAHYYGECFDITYRRFSNSYMKLKPCHVDYLKEILAEVIYAKKKENKCWALTEIKQPCFHVVSRLK
tara:strand:+ start:543 stop:1232 length:690 start_codon:yes stop_codon:yes gene_type:complete